MSRTEAGYGVIVDGHMVLSARRCPTHGLQAFYAELRSRGSGFVTLWRCPVCASIAAPLLPGQRLESVSRELLIEMMIGG